MTPQEFIEKFQKFIIDNQIDPTVGVVKMELGDKEWVVEDFEYFETFKSITFLHYKLNE